MSIVFAAVADDDTGATDLAGMLAEQDMRVILFIDEPAPQQLAKYASDADAIIVGLASRSIAPGDAYRRTKNAVQSLQGLSPKQIQVKYCSTFDSTPEGNIGPSIDGALDALDETFTIALPALPVNGRTTYMGHHFVHGQLLSDSPMRHHPLNPMTESNLVAHLQKQTRRHVGLIPYPAIRKGTSYIREQLKSFGAGIALLDCTSDEDLSTICDAIADLHLITGSSAPAMLLPSIWQRNGTWKPVKGHGLFPRRQSKGHGFLIVAGSCSPATQQQNEWLQENGAACLQLDALPLVQGEPVDAAIASKAVQQLAAGHDVLLQTSRDVELVQAWARQHGKPETQVGLKIELHLASIVREILNQIEPEGLIVAGGETSSRLARALQLKALRIGKNIEPGVPVCFSLGSLSLPIVFKSGNFGSVDFYGRAMTAIRRFAHQEK